MYIDKKIMTVFAVTTLVIAGTALASLRITATTTVTSPANVAATTASTVTTAPTPDSPAVKTVVTPAASPEAQLANAIFRILGIPVSVQEVTTYRGRNMGNGEIALAYNLAHASGRPVSDILHMRYDQKMGWGKIAKTLGVKPHGPADDTVRILHQAGLDNDADNFSVSILLDLDADSDLPSNKKNADRDEGKKHSDKGHGKDK